MEKLYEDVIIPILGHKPHYTKAYKDTLASFKSFLPRLNKIEEFMVGKTMTIADIYAASMLYLAFALIIDEGQRKAFAKVVAWYKKISSEPAFVEFFGIARFCKTALSPINPPADEEVKKDEKKPEKKKEEKKGEKAEKEGEDDGDEEEGSKKKEKNPLDLLPPSPMNIDDLKREFFVNKTADKRREYVREQFWKKLDTVGWAVWYLDYIKAEGEGQKLLFTGNLLNGFLQVALIQ
jgi:elongation factor 1-gamma